LDDHRADAADLRDQPRRDVASVRGDSRRELLGPFRGERAPLRRDLRPDQRHALDPGRRLRQRPAGEPLREDRDVLGALDHGADPQVERDHERQQEDERE
jgi:hypothetical protein